MRPVDVLRLVAPIVGACVGVWMAMRRKLVRHYQSRGAVTEEKAVLPPGSLGAPMRWWRTRLLASGELRALADGREWLDQETWARHGRARRARALGVAAVLVVLLLLAAWFAATRP
jgi:hypothetical protein